MHPSRTDSRRGPKYPFFCKRSPVQEQKSEPRIGLEPRTLAKISVSDEYSFVNCPTFTRSHLKKRILVQVRGGAEFFTQSLIPRLILSCLWVKTAGILTYFENFRPTKKVKPEGPCRNAVKRGTNKEIGLKDFFVIASSITITV